MADQMDMSTDDITSALHRLMNLCQQRAEKSIASDSGFMLEQAQDYWVLTELINQFGTALIAYDDIEGEIIN